LPLTKSPRNSRPPKVKATGPSSTGGKRTARSLEGSASDWAAVRNRRCRSLASASKSYSALGTKGDCKEHDA
jgi:hypothetical protein